MWISWYVSFIIYHQFSLSHPLPPLNPPYSSAPFLNKKLIINVDSLVQSSLEISAPDREEVKCQSVTCF